MQSITIDGTEYSSSYFINNYIHCHPTDSSDFHQKVFAFLREWYSESPTIQVKTSGSTGTPKEMCVEKERMIHSALMTCKFLDLKKSNTALLCMPVDFIAGKMMVVRSIVSGLNLHLATPTGHPLENIETEFDFAAMTPMQVYNCLTNKKEKECLKNIKSLLIGGGSIDDSLKVALENFPNRIYSTYGMTETLSHIAIRQINGEEKTDYYHPLDNISLSISENSTLVIKAPLLNKETLHTNDIVELNQDGSFRIVGRINNTINTGGIKVQIEKVESMLQPYLKSPFAISSVPDKKFGEIIVLVVEDGTQIDAHSLKNILPIYFQPKKIVMVPKIPLTETGKLDRAKIKIMTKQFI